MSLSSEITPESRAAFDELRRRGRQSVEDGHLDTAVDLFDRALAWAKDHGSADDVDRAWCGRSAAAIELGRKDEVLPRLRKILMRNRDQENCFLAAYNVARAYELGKEYHKALFYARIARERAQRVNHGPWLASSHNQVGNLHLAESYFDEARKEFEQALEHLPPAKTALHGLIYDNLGYCAVVQGRYEEGFRLLYKSLRLLRRLGAAHYYLYTHMSLCYAHLEVDRLDDALRHGVRALSMAQERSELQAVKNSLFLVGEAYLLAGDGAQAQQKFEQLQQSFYPDQEFLTDFLLAVDIRGMINLRA